MSKPLAGVRAFEAMGRSAQSRGLSMTFNRSLQLTWPLWARSAWARGWIDQHPRNTN